MNIPFVRMKIEQGSSTYRNVLLKKYSHHKKTKVKRERSYKEQIIRGLLKRIFIQNKEDGKTSKKDAHSGSIGCVSLLF